MIWLKVTKSQMALSISFHFHKNKSTILYILCKQNSWQLHIFFFENGTKLANSIPHSFPHNCLMFSKDNFFYCFPCSCEHYSTKVIFLLSKKDGPFPYCCCCLVRQRCCNNFCRIFSSLFAWRPQKNPKGTLKTQISTSVDFSKIKQQFTNLYSSQSLLDPSNKTHIFWQGHKILRNLRLISVLCSACQK